MERGRRKFLASSQPLTYHLRHELKAEEGALGLATTQRRRPVLSVQVRPYHFSRPPGHGFAHTKRDRARDCS